MARQRNNWSRAGVILILLFPLLIKAQTNLVLDPSFEQSTYYNIYGVFGTDCSGSFIPYWVSPTGGTPDWFSTSNGGAPSNFAGYQNAHSGVSYAGIGPAGKPYYSAPYREYVEGQFSNPLDSNKRYCIAFYISFADSTSLAISAIGAYISNTQICESGAYDSVLPYVPQIENPLSNLLLDSLGWQPISGEYAAKGGELYITIGDFYSDLFSDFTHVRKGGAAWTNETYYYIDDVSVREIYTAHASNTFKDTLICAGRYVYIGGDTATPGISYHWMPTTGLANPNSPQTLAAPLSTTTYTLTVVNDSMKGCNCPDSVSTDSVTVRVDHFIATACCSATITQGQTVVLNSTPASNYLWQPDTGINCDTCQSVIASPDNTTTYTVVMTDSNGCSANNALTITVKPKPTEANCGELFVPDAFSPNGDGQNDVFYVRAGCVSIFHLIIYDRWGEKVFETENINEGWDGKYRGQEENAGTYVYYLQGTYTDGSTFEKKGNVALVR